MTALTQRLTITQGWQQVATGNVTLIGCNTAANYHIYVGADTPTAKSAFVTDKLTDGKEFNYNAPVWVKLDVNNQIDEADLIVMGEAFVPPVDTTSGGASTPSTDTTGSTGGTSTQPATLTQLLNCTYDGTSLTYTGGTLESGVQGYQALSEQPINFELTHTRPNYYVLYGSESNGILDNPDSRLTLTVSDNKLSIAYRDAASRGEQFNIDLSNDIVLNTNDVVDFTATFDGLIITNKNTGQTWKSPSLRLINDFVCRGVIVPDTAPMAIKTI